MKTTLIEIISSLKELEKTIRNDKSLPTQEDFMDVVLLENKAHSALIAFATALRARHNERHPIPRDLWTEAQMAPTQPLDPETRAEIDSTP